MEQCRPVPEEICCRLNLQSTPGQLGWGIVVDSDKALPEAHVMVPTQQSCTTYKEVWLRNKHNSFSVKGYLSTYQKQQTRLRKSSHLHGCNIR